MKIKKVYLGRKQIRPEQEYPYQPTANTLVYYPLTKDFSDQSENGKDLTGANNATISTLNGVKCLDLTASSSYLSGTVSNLPQGSQARTTMCWIYLPSILNREQGVRGRGTNSTGKHDSCVTDSSSPHSIMRSNYNGQIRSNVALSTNTRIHTAVVVKGSGSTGQQIYINGVLKNSGSVTVNTSGTTLYVGKGTLSSNYLSGYLSDFIIENKARTAQEVSDYFNKTKSLYGIS